ncbi:MAG: ketopantoate reductase family protein, partial [Oscillospiraceae bacterium]|nr:ketopantoate reductase family protein [Oscillospiraceae bacterium]
MFMKTAILGCGAIGTVMGAVMTQNGCPVEMIARNEAHVKAMNENGARVVGTMDITVPVTAILPAQMSGIYDVVFILTKQNSNAESLPKLLPYLDNNSVVCTLQNGVPEPGVAKIVGRERVAGGTVLFSANLEGPGVSRLTQKLENIEHRFHIGEMSGGDTPRIRMIAELLEFMGPTLITTNLMEARWGKLVHNACISGMTAVTGVNSHDVIENPKARACLSYLGHEVKTCCEAEGFLMPTLMFGTSPHTFDIKDQAMYEENQKMFIDLRRQMMPTKSSMLRDIEKGIDTEVAGINGYVSEVGLIHGIPTPFNDTVVEIVQ